MWLEINIISLIIFHVILKSAALEQRKEKDNEGDYEYDDFKSNHILRLNSIVDPVKDDAQPPTKLVEKNKTTDIKPNNSTNNKKTTPQRYYIRESDYLPPKTLINNNHGDTDPNINNAKTAALIPKTLPELKSQHQPFHRPKQSYSRSLVNSQYNFKLDSKTQVNFPGHATSSKTSGKQVKAFAKISPGNNINIQPNAANSYQAYRGNYINNVRQQNSPGFYNYNLNRYPGSNYVPGRNLQGQPSYPRQAYQGYDNFQNFNAKAKFGQVSKHFGNIGQNTPYNMNNYVRNSGPLDTGQFTYGTGKIKNGNSSYNEKQTQQYQNFLRQQNLLDQEPAKPGNLNQNVNPHDTVGQNNITKPQNLDSKPQSQESNSQNSATQSLNLTSQQNQSPNQQNPKANQQSQNPNQQNPNTNPQNLTTNIQSSNQQSQKTNSINQQIQNPNFQNSEAQNQNSNHQIQNPHQQNPNTNQQMPNPNQNELESQIPSSQNQSLSSQNKDSNPLNLNSSQIQNQTSLGVSTPVPGDTDYVEIPGWYALAYPALTKITTAASVVTNATAVNVTAPNFLTTSTLYPTQNREYHPIVAKALKNMWNLKMRYFSGFASTLCEIIVFNKIGPPVQQLARGMETVLARYVERGLLTHFGETTMHALEEYIALLDARPLDEIRLEVSAGYHMYRNHSLFAEDTQAILMEIEDWYKVSEGENLLNTLVPVFFYPQNGMEPDQVAKVVVKALMKPYFRLGNDQRRILLLELVEEALILRRNATLKKYIGEEEGEVATRRLKNTKINKDLHQVRERNRIRFKNKLSQPNTNNEFKKVITKSKLSNKIGSKSINQLEYEKVHKSSSRNGNSQRKFQRNKINKCRGVVATNHEREAGKRNHFKHYSNNKIISRRKQQQRHKDNIDAMDNANMKEIDKSNKHWYERNDRVKARIAENKPISNINARETFDKVTDKTNEFEHKGIVGSRNDKKHKIKETANAAKLRFNVKKYNTILSTNAVLNNAMATDTNNNKGPSYPKSKTERIAYNRYNITSQNMRSNNDKFNRNHYRRFINYSRNKYDKRAHKLKNNHILSNDYKNTRHKDFNDVFCNERKDTSKTATVKTNHNNKRRCNSFIATTYLYDNKKTENLKFSYSKNIIPVDETSKYLTINADLDSMKYRNDKDKANKRLLENFIVKHEKRKAKKSVLKDIVEASSYSDAEEDIKFNLNDAVRHGDLMISNSDRINFKAKENAIKHELTSESDDEVILKSNIYRVFG